MTKLLTDDPVIMKDLEWLCSHDIIFSSVFANSDIIEREKGLGGMPGLIRIVIGQQISTSAARSLWQKFTDKFDPNDTRSIIEANDNDLRSCGLSKQKIAYVKGLAESIENRELQPETWTEKDSETITKEITSLKGFGLWSAHMVLMFHLARPDIWPYGDLGIQNGLQIYLNLKERPKENDTKDKVALFKGRETAAALLLWKLTEK